VAVIINNEEFDPDLEITDRPGSRKDEQSLTETFHSLGFEEVLVRRNLNAEPMVSFLKEGISWIIYRFNLCKYK